VDVDVVLDADVVLSCAWTGTIRMAAEFLGFYREAGEGEGRTAE
jgi:hypothetical protein